MLRVTILIPDGDSGKEAFLDYAETLRYRILAIDPVTDDGLPQDIQLTDLMRLPADKLRVEESAVVWLQELTQMTAYEAWQRLGGRLAHHSNYKLVRTDGNVFRIICQAMISRQLRFTDLDPVTFQQYEPHGWTGLGAAPREANLLSRMEVLDARILMRLTDADIRQFFNAGPKLAKSIMKIRDALNDA